MAFDVAVDDADQRVVQILQRGRRLAHGPDALVRGRRDVFGELIKPSPFCYPLHDDEGVGGVQAGCHDLHAVGVPHLQKEKHRNDAEAEGTVHEFFLGHSLSPEEQFLFQTSSRHVDSKRASS